MSDTQTDPERRQMVLTSQIIVGALVAGCLFFLLIVLAVAPGKFGGWEVGPEKPLTLVGLVAAFGMLGARVIQTSTDNRLLAHALNKTTYG